MNRNNQFKRMRFRSLSALSHSMDSSGKRKLSNSGSIVIAVVLSAKDIILRRSKQTDCNLH